MKFVIYLSCFAFIFTTICSCSGDKSKITQSKNINVCEKKRKSIVLFIDLQAKKKDKDNTFHETNKKRIEVITDEIKSTFISYKFLFPFDLFIFPLGHNSSRIEPVFSYTSRDENEFNYCKGYIDRVSVNRMRGKFSPTSFLNDTTNSFYANSNSTYKQIYPSVKPFFHKFKNLKTEEVIVIYYSDFLEKRGPQSSAYGNYLFIKPYGQTKPLKFALDCKAIDTAQAGLEKEELPLSKMIQKYHIGKTNFQGKIQVYLIKDNDPLEEVKLDNCENQELLDEYWEAFFAKLGLEPESQLNWTSISDIQKILLK